MINLEQLAERQNRQPELPILTDTQVIASFVTKIEDIKQRVMKPIRVWEFDHSKDRRTLYTMVGGKDHTHVLDINGKTIGRVENKRIQTLGLEVMGHYGLDPAISFEGWIMEGSVFDSSPIQLKDGTYRDITTFPSQCTEGLSFQRTVDYSSEGEERKVHGIKWNVVDEAPEDRFDLFGRIKQSLVKK